MKFAILRIGCLTAAILTLVYAAICGKMWIYEGDSIPHYRRRSLFHHSLIAFNSAYAGVSEAGREEAERRLIDAGYKIEKQDATAQLFSSATECANGEDFVSWIGLRQNQAQEVEVFLFVPMPDGTQEVTCFVGAQMGYSLKFEQTDVRREVWRVLRGGRDQLDSLSTGRLSYVKMRQQF